MAKRHSPRRSSLSATSSMADYENDGATDVLPKPSKRLKTADGSAAVSPGSTTAQEPEPEDEEMQDGPVSEKVKKEPKPRRKARSSVKAEARGDDDVEVEVEIEEGDAADATVVHRTDDANDANEGRDGNEPNDAHDHHNNLLETMSSVSEDTDGDVPLPKKGSSYHRLAEDEINNNEPQVTVCAWDGCNTGDLKTMDRLVEHLHSEHVEGKQRRYTCEWIGCPRKGKSHASAYALKAHLRSHTREKPHVCLLPECDQAFARQDALNKHMRTAHDIDLMRTIDPGSRGVQVGGKGSAGAANGNTTNGNSSSSAPNANTTTNGKGGSSKLKIIIKTPQSHAAGHDDSVDNGDEHNYVFVNMAGTETTTLTKDQGFTSHELEMPPKELYGLCRSQLRWAEDESEDLRKECAAWEETYLKAWLEQQVLLDQVIQSEKDWYERRKAVLASLAVEEEKRAAEAAAKEAEEDAAEAEAEAAADRGDGVKDEDDSAGDDDNDNIDGDGDGDGDGEDDDEDDVPSIALGPDATREDFSFAETTSFSAVGSSLRNEVAINGD